MTKFRVSRVAVLGAGVMGAQIAAHLANAGMTVLLYDLAADAGDPSAISAGALKKLARIEPAPLATKEALKSIQALNYDQHVDLLADCDIVIEAIAERMDWKQDLYAKVVPALGEHCIFVSNTSGLSINALAESLPEAQRTRFCGVHFFNPPRYMKLVELIPTKYTSAEVLDQLESWLTTTLGKGVVRALDTPNFIANRIGVFSILAAMHHTERLGLGFDEVDALSGSLINRPRSATYRTADLVGLDTLAHVINTLKENATDDPWHAYFDSPVWLKALIEKGALGQKTRAGVYQRVGKEIQVLDLQKQDYVPSEGTAAEEVVAILKQKDPQARLLGLRDSEHPQAQFLWSVLRDTFHYSAVQLKDIAQNARDLDLAMRWGFGWSQGPLEQWQEAGWQAIAQAIQEDIKAGKTMSNTPLPDWVLDSDRNGVHEAAGSYSASEQALQTRSTLPVYKRQLFVEQLHGEQLQSLEQETIWENKGVRLWSLPTIDKGIAILSIHSKMHTIGNEVLIGILQAVAKAEQQFDGLVLWHEAPFAVGANLQQVAEAVVAGDFVSLEAEVARFQQTSLALRYAQIPTVAAVEGLALGGGCEFLMHADSRVLALESYIGLVEAGVGLIPAGGGSKDFAVRAAKLAEKTETPMEVFPFLAKPFRQIAMAEVAKSAIQAQEVGFAKASDKVVFHPGELLYTALKQARALADMGYYPPAAPTQVTVAGRGGIANFDMLLINMLEGCMISEHDYRVAHAAAVALCGGDIDSGSKVNEEWLLAVERQEFVKLLRTPETLARIQHTLKTGKPLRN
ncbi:MAG: 3-hydroxyacyl-CoA dehydrogenase/enoyl-CoA hydratase family protein [Alcaligenaceae bacterium]|nr:3-hydroxyacyl-CoA dehydrogenase/enoyl-CoA hydratase family protein [Alcaligenaceae bacterium]